MVKIVPSIFSVLLIFLSHNIQAQHSVIDLDPVNLNIPDRRFYIVEVLDLRKDTTYLAKHAKPYNSIKFRTISFQNSLRDEFEVFFSRNLLFKTGMKPLVIIVNDLVLDKVIVKEQRFSKVVLNTTYFEKANDTYVLVDSVSVSTLVPEIDFEDSYGTAISKALVESLVKVNAAINDDINFDNTNFEVPLDHQFIDKAALISASEENVDSVSQQRKEVLPTQPVNIMSYSHYWGNSANGFKINYYSTATLDRDWIIPFLFNFEYITEIKSRGFSRSISNHTVNLGLTVLRRLSNRSYFRISGSVPLGYEKLGTFSERDQIRLLLGFRSSQGFMFIPKNAYGISFGGGLEQTFINSSLFDKNYAFYLELGFKF